MAWRVDGCEVCCQASIGAASGGGGGGCMFTFGQCEKKRSGGGPC